MHVKEIQQFIARGGRRVAKGAGNRFTEHRLGLGAVSFFIEREVRGKAQFVSEKSRHPRGKGIDGRDLEPWERVQHNFKGLVAGQPTRLRLHLMIKQTLHHGGKDFARGGPREGQRTDGLRPSPGHDKTAITARKREGFAASRRGTEILRAQVLHDLTSVLDGAISASDSHPCVPSPDLACGHPHDARASPRRTRPPPASWGRRDAYANGTAG